MLQSRVILLNGTSSAGKSSLAKELQSRLGSPYLHVCIDSFEKRMPERYDLGGDFAKKPSSANCCRACIIPWLHWPGAVTT